jgi:hypothetical protein
MSREVFTWGIKISRNFLLIKLVTMKQAYLPSNCNEELLDMK